MVFVGRWGISVLPPSVRALSICSVFITAPLNAQQGESNCSEFDSQEEAQAELGSEPGDPNNLDGDDGEAREIFFEEEESGTMGGGR